MDFTSWNAGQWIVIGLCGFLVAWYVIFAYLNRRRGLQIYRWLRDGLEGFGPITNVKWIGSSGSGMQISLEKAAAPFKTIEVVCLLETRELLPLWLVNRMRNKGDELILRASLQPRPTQSVEVARTGDREFARLAAYESELGYEDLPAAEGFQIAVLGIKKPQGLEQLNRFLQEAGSNMQSISLQRKNPHLVLRSGLRQWVDEPAEKTLSALREWLELM